MGHDVQTVRSYEHPGAGRKRAKSTPKGLLIEYLHLVQDKYRQISAAHLAALADEMKLAFAEVFETATFYAHFDVVKEGEADIAPVSYTHLRAHETDSYLVCRL